jgi:hypothetical protein
MHAMGSEMSEVAIDGLLYPLGVAIRLDPN